MAEDEIQQGRHGYGVGEGEQNLEPEGLTLVVLATPPT